MAGERPECEGGIGVTSPEQVARAREAALNASLHMHLAEASRRGLIRHPEGGNTEQKILDTASRFYAWLTGTVTLTLHEGPVVSQATGKPTGTTHPEGENMQLHDDEKFNLSVDTKDAKGFETSDAIDWAASDGGTILALTVASDGRSCEVVAVAPGSAVITVTDNATTPPMTATEAVDVVPAGTATVSLAEGSVEKQ
jgi:hypothetical protein